MPGYEFRLPSYPSTAFPSLTTAHVGSIARDRTIGGIRMYTGTSTNWTHLGGELLNVKDPVFGAVGDGVTDDTAAIQAAIDQAAVSVSSGGISLFGNIVFMPRGTYIVTSRIIVKAGVTLMGAGQNATVIKAGATFPINTELVRLGPTPGGDVLTARIYLMSLHCSDIAGSIGVTSAIAQNGSGLIQVNIHSCRDWFVDWQAGAASIIMDTVECFAGINPFTGGVRFSSVSGQNEIRHLIVTGDLVGTGTDGVYITNSDVVLFRVSAEKVTNVVRFDVGSLGSVIGATGHPTVTNTINITAGAQGQVTLIGLNKNGGTNVVNDAYTGRTITNSSLQFYVVGSDGAKMTIASAPNIDWALNSNVAMGDGSNFSFGTISGTKIGTSIAQKLGFWNATPIIQPSSYTTAAITTNRAWPTTASISTDAGGAQFTSRADFEAFVQVVHQMYLDLRGMGLLK